MRKLLNVLGYIEKLHSEEMLAFFRATRHFQIWDAIRMKVATDAAAGMAVATAAAATGEVTDVLKYFSGTFVETLLEEFTNLHKELTAEDNAAEKKEETTEKMAEDTAAAEKRTDLVVGAMDDFSSEEMMAFFRATWHFQMWNAIRMQAATDAATPEVPDVRKYFSETFANTVFDEFTNLHKEPTAEEKAAEKEAEQVLKKAEQKFKEAEEKKEEAPAQLTKEPLDAKAYLDSVGPRQAARLVKICKQNNPNFKDPRDDAPPPKRQATGSSSPKAE